ncbi:hypothetical protein ACRYCC_03330 [Actinomadura scrupuli]|uniref:hypothetical protein n=1 Tax=Actinomadura scrupuli TaxID=559629 RepID=UPI003D95B971
MELEVSLDRDYDTLLRQVRENTFADQQAVEKIVAEQQAGSIDQREAKKWLLALDQGVELGPFDISKQQVDTEWVTLLNEMSAEATEWQGIAKSQFRQGFYLLPASILVIFLITLFADHNLGAKDAVLYPLAGACLAAVAAHSFFVFRVHQQARLAAERLSEKRAAILFLRLAIGRSNDSESAQILTAGTAMFLGHHAAAAVPLQPEDFSKK